MLNRAAERAVVTRTMGSHGPGENIKLLKESCNKERQDIKPLPEWTVADLTDVELYYTEVAPACMKVRLILELYEVPHTLKLGKKAESSYRKVPVLMLNARQINDSYIIVKNLSPILDGAPLPPHLLKFEEEMTYGLMLAMQRHVASEVSELMKCWDANGGLRTWTGLNFSCLCMFSPCVAPVARVFYKGRSGVKSIEHYGNMIRDAIDREGDAFLHGSAPGICDVALCGMLLLFAEAKNESFSILMECGLRGWWSLMSRIIQPIVSRLVPQNESDPDGIFTTE